MFKRISRRFAAGLMASAVVLSNIIMPVQQAFADGTATSTPAPADGIYCNDSTLQNIEGDGKSKAATETVWLKDYQTGYKDDERGIRWFYMSQTGRITNTSNYVISDIATLIGQAGTNDYTDSVYHGMTWNNTLGAYVITGAATSLKNPLEGNEGYTMYYVTADGSPTARANISNYPEFRNPFPSKWISPSIPVAATDSIPALIPAKTSLAPGESTTFVYATKSEVRENIQGANRNIASAQAHGIIHCNAPAIDSINPSFSANKVDCDTISIKAAELGTYYQGVVRIFDENGNNVKEVLASHNNVHANDANIDQTVDLPTGHTYTLQLDLFDETTNKSYTKATTTIDMTAGCPTYTPTWLNCHAFELAWKNMAAGSTIRIIWKDANGKWLGYTDQTARSKTWGKYDMPLNTASVEYIVTDSTGAVVTDQTVQNTTPCSSKADWTSCDSFAVNTSNLPAGDKVQINWEENGQAQSTTISANTTNTTGWWSGTGRQTVKEFSYKIIDASGRVLYTSNKIVKTTKCTVTPVAPIVNKDCTVSVPENVDGITYKKVYLDTNGNIVNQSSITATASGVLATANDGYVLDVDGKLVDSHVFILDFSDAQCGSGYVDPTTPSKPTTPVVTLPIFSGEQPKVTTTATALPVPAELPETGTSWNGLVVALVAALSTYGAVFFAQGKREY